jgi:hypothetical protein
VFRVDRAHIAFSKLSLLRVGQRFASDSPNDEVEPTPLLGVLVLKGGSKLGIFRLLQESEAWRVPAGKKFVTTATVTISVLADLRNSQLLKAI